MDKFLCCGHSIVVMEKDELEKILTDANAKGYVTGHLEDYKLGKKV